ncbi:hypothetical protein [Candidatus Methylacidithermus pantelleriae]|uniref:hypothetical protein n=1 Tax=Candidatus Methylacidithermus pantelleriae TaxID=2744239 RepID=UPI00157CE0B8|nr:hypothetical protein [Candidatus Methylacidithermus pantelleriae]
MNTVLRVLKTSPGLWISSSRFLVGTNADGLTKLHPELFSWAKKDAEKVGVAKEPRDWATKLNRREDHFHNRVPLVFSAYLLEIDVPPLSNLPLFPKMTHQGFDNAFYGAGSEGFKQPGRKSCFRWQKLDATRFPSLQRA